jgi:hypothetical protein
LPRGNISEANARRFAPILIVVDIDVVIGVDIGVVIGVVVGVVVGLIIIIAIVEIMLAALILRGPDQGAVIIDLGEFDLIVDVAFLRWRLLIAGPIVTRSITTGPILASLVPPASATSSSTAATAGFRSFTLSGAFLGGFFHAALDAGLKLGGNCGFFIAGRFP